MEGRLHSRRRRNRDRRYGRLALYVFIRSPRDGYRGQPYRDQQERNWQQCAEAVLHELIQAREQLLYEPENSYRDN